MISNPPRLRSALLLAAILMLPAATLPAQTLTPAFTYQGELQTASGPANAAFDMQFRLFSAASGGSQVGATVTRTAVQVQDGLFSVALDFGTEALVGDRRWLDIRIRPAGSGNYETLSPRSEVTAAPYAWGAALALPNSVTSASIVDGAVGTAKINAAQIQRRVTGSCPAGQYIRAINQNGSVSCGTDANSGGTVTSIATGTGLSGGPITASGTIAIANGGVGTAQINAGQVQRRVSGSCPAGQYMRQVNQDGTVVCEDDAVGPAGWTLGGNAGTNAATDFLGTTDAQALELRTGNARSLRLEPSDILFEGLPVTTNTIGGSQANNVTPGVRGATIAGGGAPLGSNDLFSDAAPNRVTDHYGTAGGGYNNRAGDDEGAPSSAMFATVGGGFTNTAGAAYSTVGGGWRNRAEGSAATIGGGDRNIASGADSTVAGGSANWATAPYAGIGGGWDNRASGERSYIGGGWLNAATGYGSSVSGGLRNCAGGRYSWAGGFRAKVRPGAAPGWAACSELSYPGGNGDQGTFAWADSQETNFISNGENQFLVRASGSVQFTHDNNVASNTVGWFRIRAPSGRDPLTVTSGGAGVLTGFSNSGVRIGNTTSLFPPTPGANGLLVMGGARRNDNQASWDTTSDARVKHAVEPIEGAIDTLLALRPTRFRYRPEFLADHGGEDREHVGFIAQELADVLPQAVHAAKDESGLMQINLSEVHVLTTAATRELAIGQRAISEELVELRSENTALRAHQARLDAELAELRQLLAGLLEGGR